MALNYDLINKDFAVPAGYYRNADGDWQNAAGQIWDPTDQYMQSLNTGSSFGINPEDTARWQSLADFSSGGNLNQYLTDSQGAYTTSTDKYGSTIISPTSGQVGSFPEYAPKDFSDIAWMLPLMVAGAGLAAGGLGGTATATGGMGGGGSSALGGGAWGAASEAEMAAALAADATAYGTGTGAFGYAAPAAAGATGAGGTTLGGLINPTQVASSAAGSLLGDGMGGLGSDATSPGFNADEFSGASGGYSGGSGSGGGGALDSLMKAFGLGSGGNLMPLGNLLGGLIGAGTGLAGANIQADAAKQAAANQMAMFNTINQQQAPWRQAGQNALGQIGGMSDYFNHQFNANDLNANLAPNWQFQRDQGLMATNNALNLQSGWSGNTLRGINDYAQNFAGGAYQNAFNNYQAQQNNIFNRLANIAGLGQTATANTGNAGTTLAGNAGTATQNAGTAMGGGVVGAGNAVSGGINNALGWYSLPSILNGSYS